VDEGQGPGVQFRTDGELVPMLTMELDGSMPVFFEHHILLWKTPSLEIGIHAMKGTFKRVIAGMPIFMTEAKGRPDRVQPGRSGARVPPGSCPRPVAGGARAPVPGRHRERRLQLPAIARCWEHAVRRHGHLHRHLHRRQGGGTVWLHGYGNVFERVLGPGETFDVEPGGWVYKDPTVAMEIKMVGLRMGMLGGSGNLVFNRFTGPGRIGIQTMYLHMPTED